MPPRHPRLEDDVDNDEEQELRRLENGRVESSSRRPRQAAPPRSAAQSRPSGAESSEGSWADALRAAREAGETAAPLGAAEGTVLAPYAVTRTACLVEKLSETTWRVAMGDAVAHFLAANGPPEIVCYNLLKVKGAWSCPVCVRRHPVVLDGPRFAHHDFADLLELTSIGKRELAKPETKQPLVYKLELACSGASHGLPKRAADPCNCARVCCGALGAACSCARKPHQGCTVRVLITATPALVEAGKVKIELRNSHVPAGEQAVPPPLSGLRIDAHLRQQLVTLCKSSKQTPTTAIADLVPELKLAQRSFAPSSATADGVGGGDDGGGDERPPLNNTRFNPRPSVIANALKYLRRELRGPAAIGDWERVNRLVREQLIQHDARAPRSNHACRALPRSPCAEHGCAQAVLLYVPFTVSADGSVVGIVVLASGWSLRMACENPRLLGTDCKHDTSAGKSMWSSARVATPKGWAPAIAWIAPTETTDLLEAALLVLAENVACRDARCRHAVQVEWGQHGHGSYRRRLECARWYRPRLCCDKHMPTLKAAKSAGYGDPILDGYHAYHCVGDQLNKIGIHGEAAVEAMWLFRLWTRSADDAQAADMRECVVAHTLERAAAASPPWTLEQAILFIDYFDKCWHLPPSIRRAQIDQCRLSLDADLTPSTGANEGDHRWFDEHFFHCQINRDVTTVVMNTAGVAADGRPIRGYFDSAEQRYAHKEPTVSVDVRLCEARAALEFLSLVEPFWNPEAEDVLADGWQPWSERLPEFAGNAVGAYGESDDAVFVQHFAWKCLKRHEDSSLHSFSPMPKCLEPMLHELKHGGPHSFSMDGYYAIDPTTGRCECMASTYHGVRSAFGPCKHERFCKLVMEVRAAHGAEAVVAIVQREYNKVRHLVYHREKSKPALVRCDALFVAADPKARASFQYVPALLVALAENNSVPPTGKSTGLPEDDEHEQLLQANVAQPAGDVCETCTCTFATSDLGIAFVVCGTHGVQAVAYVKLRDGTTLGPARHAGAVLRPGDLVTRIDGVNDLSGCVGMSGLLELSISPPLKLHFKRNWRPLQGEVGKAGEPLTDAASATGASAGASSDQWAAGSTWIVETILKSRECDAGMEYYCRWEGWSTAYDSWEPEEHILDDMLIEDYWRRAGKPRPTMDAHEADEDANDEPDVAEPITQPTAATGRPAKRKAKFPSQRPSGAPRRRGKKPCRRRPDELAMLEVPPASLDMSVRVAQCKERLLSRAGEEEEAAAQECVNGMTYVE